jgi:acetylornithine/N-succinyldiaminopimelate aminotransferase
MLGLKCKAPNMDLVNAAYGHQLLIVPASDNVVRLLPALNISNADISEAVNRLEKTAEYISKGLNQ